VLHGIEPTWQVSSKVRGITTFRSGGVSAAPYHSLNLGLHVGDVPAAVLQNRLLLEQHLHLPNPPYWLNQTHSTNIIRVGTDTTTDIPEADASYTNVPECVLAIMTADCLPLFLSTLDGSEVALIHCGWRGVANGIIERTLQQFTAPLSRLHAWLGPAIGPNNFEVGSDVKMAMACLSTEHENYFKQQQDRWLLDLFGLVTNELRRLNVGCVASSNVCTVEHEDRFFSYRRDGITGRMVSLLWRTE